MAMQENNKPWTYSHTQLALWRQCKRRYYDSYILGHKEPTTDNMAAGTWLCQYPIETVAQGLEFDDARMQGAWANFLADFGGDDIYDSPLFTLKLAKQILAAYKAAPVAGKVVEIEHTYTHDFGGGLVYTSRPDLVTEEEVLKPNGIFQVDIPEVRAINRTTWDIKLKTFNQAYKGDTNWVKPELSPFDDQCLGQAVLAQADSFGQIQFWLGKKDGTLVGPVYVEQPVSAVLADEWKREAISTCNEMEYARMGHISGNPILAPFPKNSAACHNFGRPCPQLDRCKFGFQPLTQPMQNDKGDGYADRSTK